MKQVEVKKRILAANEEAAGLLRRRFAEHAILVVDLISSPGSGKTTLLEETAKRLRERVRMAALVGDVATELDADRLRSAGLPAHQICTAGACHLDARMIAAALEYIPFPGIDILLIENVGNLICPTSYDLGEDMKVALLSVTEGHDKPFKYPAIFTKAGVTVITKMDLLPHVQFDLEAACAQVGILNPNARICKTSMSGTGMDTWCDVLQNSLHLKRRTKVSA